MEYETSSGQFIVNLTSEQIGVMVGDAAKMEVQKAVNYIESGRAELEPLVIRAETASVKAETAANKSELYAATFIYEQAIASDTWQIEHNLNKRPSVTVVDSAENIITTEVEYIDNNNVVVRMNGATTGKAYLN